jgi:hypothetical protein
VPDDKAIKIDTLNLTTPSPTITIKLLKQPPRKRVKKATVSEKADDLCNKDFADTTISPEVPNTANPVTSTAAPLHSESQQQQPSFPPSGNAPLTESNQNLSSANNEGASNDPEPSTSSNKQIKSVPGSNAGSPTPSNCKTSNSTSALPPDTTDPNTGHASNDTPAANVAESRASEDTNPHPHPSPTSATPAHTQPQLPTGPNPTPSTNYKLSILKSADVKIKLLHITQGYKTKPSWKNYQDLWHALSSLV